MTDSPSPRPLSPQFQLQQELDYLYATAPRRLAFRAQTVDEFHAWQAALRAEVTRMLGLTGRALPLQVQAERLQAVDRGAYVEEKYALEVGDSVPAPMYVLVPKTPPPYKAILAFHGHYPSVHYILGNYPDEEEKREALAIDNNYAQVLAQAGYLVCAVEQRGFGERLTLQTHLSSYFEVSCRHLSFEYMMQGRSLLGERIWDGMVALSYLQSRADVVPGVMGATGHSGGGTTTLWMAALDERITVIVPTCYFCSFKHSILGMRHCECNYVPGILQYGEMGDLAALLAPRPFRAIAGEHDPIYPVEGVRQQWATVQRAYDLLGAGDRCSLVVHPGGHAYHHAHSQDWFARWL